MIYVSLIPAWIWITAIVFAWGTCAYQTYSRIGFQHSVTKGLIVVFTLQAIVASSSVIATSRDHISEFACIMGVFGTFGTVAIILAKVIVLIFLYRVCLQNSSERRQGLVVSLSAWIGFSVVVFLAHYRSALMCTV
jgi:hypothetical protein